ncbi:plasmid replication initiator TrfA [Ralstonia sp. SET104]|uniref:plasmid replication initiator TrfA n=1 Tax=Ralstonia sp. SET104 TaxID=2448774 RepID=UPI000F583FE6|nr:plasmid replication initiator TrfA [Ralstonia sp. SET104]GCB06662.1 TrfA family protein [Ralstonia sp. SET104]
MTQPTPSIAERASDIERKALSKSRAKRRAELAELMANGQLALWPESERGIPNEVVRCAVFSAKNRKEKRETYRAGSPLVVPVVGGGEVIWIGEELRQDDETVWMQLVHLAKEARSEWVTFTPYSFLKSIGWPIKGESYTRLLTCIRRLASGGLEVYSSRFDKGCSTKLLAKYVYSKTTDEPWKVQVFHKDDELLFLFDKLYSRLDWETRLNLPEGVATWLHGFFASHREPYPHKVETLAIGAGLTLEKAEDAALPPESREAKRKERLREAKKTIKRGLEALKEKGFLDDFDVTRDGLVSVQRAERKQAAIDL